MLVTDQGEFPSLATLRGAYLRAHDGNPPLERYFRSDKEWDESVLHLSDLGKCARQQCYRILGAVKKRYTQSKLDNDELMYYQGNVIHALTVGACDWAGILHSFEQPLEVPAGWTGHYDLVFNDRSADEHVLWDGKSTRPNAFRYWYSWPKPELVAQMRGYLHFLPIASYGLGEYIDRGGSNTPRLYRIDNDRSWVFTRMGDLEDALALARERGVLPDVLPRSYEATYWKVRNEPLHRISTIKFKPSWQCEWCDYCYPGLCQPVLESIDVAKYIKGKLEILEPLHATGVVTFLETAVREYAEDEVAED